MTTPTSPEARVQKAGQKYRRKIRVGRDGESDIHAICDAYETTSSISQAVKKLLMAGKRGAKDKAKDYKEAIENIERELEFDAVHEESIAEDSHNGG